MSISVYTRLRRDPAILRLIAPFPLRCAACGLENDTEHVLCEECLARLAGEPPINRFADEKLFADSAAAHMYYSQSAALVSAFKYSGTRVLVNDMGFDMLSAWDSLSGRAVDLITFVPMPKRRAKHRFYNQSEVLAKYLSPRIGALCEKTLRRTRECKQQAQIENHAERLENVRGAFAPVRRLDGQSVLLVDDVYTTGATARECARELLGAGAGSVMLLCYALAGQTR